MLVAVKGVVCGLSIPDIVVSNPAGDMAVVSSSLSCVVYSGLCDEPIRI